MKIEVKIIPATVWVGMVTLVLYEIGGSVTVYMVSIGMELDRFSLRYSVSIILVLPQRHVFLPVYKAMVPMATCNTYHMILDVDCLYYIYLYY